MVKQIRVNEVIDSSVADSEEKGEKVFDALKKTTYWRRCPVILNFDGVEVVSNAFLVSIICKLYNASEYDIDRNPVRLSHMDKTMLNMVSNIKDAMNACAVNNQHNRN